MSPNRPLSILAVLIVAAALLAGCTQAPAPTVENKPVTVPVARDPAPSKLPPQAAELSNSLVNSERATVSWSLAGPRDLSSFVEYGPGPTQIFKRTETQAGPGVHHADILGLSPLTKYYYQVAVARGDNVISRTPLANFTTLAPTVAVDPGAPCTLEITSVAFQNGPGTGITLTWTVSGRPGSVSRIHYGTTEAYGLVTSDILGTGRVSQQIFNLQSGTTYRYEIEAEGCEGQVAHSIPAAFVAPDPTGAGGSGSQGGGSGGGSTGGGGSQPTCQAPMTGTPPNCVSPPGECDNDTQAPTITAVDFTAPTDSSTTLSWTVSDASGQANSRVAYDVDTAPAGIFSQYTAFQPGVGSLNQQLAGLTSETTYRFHVTAVDICGNQAVSGALTFTTAVSPFPIITFGPGTPPRACSANANAPAQLCTFTKTQPQSICLIYKLQGPSSMTTTVNWGIGPMPTGTPQPPYVYNLGSIAPVPNTAGGLKTVCFPTATNCGPPKVCTPVGSDIPDGVWEGNEYHFQIQVDGAGPSVLSSDFEQWSGESVNFQILKKDDPPPAGCSSPCFQIDPTEGDPITYKTPFFFTVEDRDSASEASPGTPPTVTAHQHQWFMTVNGGGITNIDAPVENNGDLKTVNNQDPNLGWNIPGPSGTTYTVSCKIHPNMVFFFTV